jgi:ornithine carbamoyltransferase
MRHLRTLLDLSADDLREILDLASDLKDRLRAGDRAPRLPGRVLTMVFEKPSLRTRVSFEAAMAQLGGAGVFMSAKDAGLKGREALRDVARVLSGYSDVVALRTYSQALIEEFAAWSNCPVINALSDDRHPCQALTDLFTVRELFGDLDRRIVFIGDGNNVAASLAIGTAMLGMPITFCCPTEYCVDPILLEMLETRFPKADFNVTDNPERAVRDADVIYTDVWASMGQESESAERREVFRPFQVNAALMARAPKHARFMHDLPARRGQEVTDEVLDGPQSAAFVQAENRMHLAKGLLTWIVR